MLVHFHMTLPTLQQTFFTHAASGLFAIRSESRLLTQPSGSRSIRVLQLIPGLNAAHGPMRKMKTLACLLQKNSPPAAIPLHFLQLYRSTLGGVIAEWPSRSQCVCAHVCFSLLMHPPVVDLLLWEGVNPLNLNRADVSAHHSVSSVLHAFLFYPPVETQSTGYCGGSLFQRHSDCVADETLKTQNSNMLLCMLLCMPHLFAPPLNSLF